VTIAYWLLGATVAWCYVGYPLFVALQARFRPRPIRLVGSAPEPSVVVVVAVRNEAAFVEARLENLLTQEYPVDRLDVVVVCNGTTDGTDGLAERIARNTHRVRVVRSAAEAGKSGALNRGIAEARAADVVVFADARQVFDPRAVRELVAPFSDPAVGAVTGRLLVERAPRAAVEGMRLYWGLESRLRAWESRSGSVVGATGAIYAVRRALAPTLPPSLILDDVYLPLTIGMRGMRIVMAENALAFDIAAKDAATEYRRKRRTMVGNIQLLTSVDGLLSPARNPLFARFVSHKALRLLTPFCLVAMLALSGARGGPLYGSLFAVQAGIYLLGIAGLVARIPKLSFASAFVLIHMAIFAAVYRWRQNAADVWLPDATAAPSGSPYRTAPMEVGVSSHE
jgi:biofilm PGA synthesis N-glycosyltransferase PgaC